MARPTVGGDAGGTILSLAEPAQPKQKETLVKSLPASLLLKGGKAFPAFSIPLLSKEGLGEIMLGKVERTGHDFSQQNFMGLIGSSVVQRPRRHRVVEANR
jgi:hypothetical protein